MVLALNKTLYSLGAMFLVLTSQKIKTKYLSQLKYNM